MLRRRNVKILIFLKNSDKTDCGKGTRWVPPSSFKFDNVGNRIRQAKLGQIGPQAEPYGFYWQGAGTPYVDNKKRAAETDKNFIAEETFDDAEGIKNSENTESTAENENDKVSEENAEEDGSTEDKEDYFFWGRDFGKKMLRKKVVPYQSLKKSKAEMSLCLPPSNPALPVLEAVYLTGFLL